jgi:hypothetical protein
MIESEGNHQQIISIGLKYHHLPEQTNNMQQQPISSKEALARFNRASSVSHPTGNSSSSSLSATTAGHFATRTILTTAAGSLFSIAASSKSPFAAKNELRSLSETQQQRRFPTNNNNLFRILEETKLSSLPPSLSSNHESCCANEFNLNCDHSGTCSACSESTMNSSDESEDARKNIPGFGWAKKQKTKSQRRMMKAEVKKEKGAEGLKDFVYNSTFMEFYEMQKKGCNERCAHGRHCLKKVSIEYVGALRENFWGKRADKALKPAARKAKIQDIFSTANALIPGEVS